MVNAKDKIKKDIREKIKNIVFDTHRHIILNTPVDTGRLRSSIVVEERGDGWVIGTNVEYAPFVELDTKPHIIEPKNKQALKFEVGRKQRLAAGKSPGQANIVFAKKVQHPGTEGSHMFLKGVKYFERRMKNLK